MSSETVEQWQAQAERCEAECKLLLLDAEREQAYLRQVADVAQLHLSRYLAAEKVTAELLRALLKYGEHKPGCASQWRAATGSSQIRPCDCGLQATIANAERP